MSAEQADISDLECDRVFTVMVLGAGRGPLVRATLNAADITKTKVKVRTTSFILRLLFNYTTTIDTI